MTKVFRGALIGCGYISERQLVAWAKIENAEIVAVADTDLSKAQHRATEFGIESVHTDYVAMLESETLDFVDIATRPETHLDMVTGAANHGLQVFCQKPIAPTLSELRQMIEVCKQAGVTFMVNENMRFQRWFRKMKQLLDDGAIGQPFYANVTHRYRGSLPEPRFNRQPYLADMPRLMLYEMGVHDFDTLSYLLGDTNSVYAQIHHVSPHIAGDDVAIVTLQMNGVTALLDASWASVPVSKPTNPITWAELKIEGTDGTLSLAYDGVLRLITDDDEQHIPFPADTILDCFQATQQHFIDCLESGAEPETGGRHTLKIMEILFGAYDSAEHNYVYRIGTDVDRLK